VTVLKQRLSPGFFTYQPGSTSYVAAWHSNGTRVGPAGQFSTPAAPDEVIELYGTGFGATNPSLPTSQAFTQAAPLALPAAVTIGGLNATVQWAGIVSPGLYQLKVKVPNVATGDQTVQTSIGGFQSPSSVFLPVKSN
jgi:uncharacterized protein (TIGR03437 family)